MFSQVLSQFFYSFNKNIWKHTVLYWTEPYLSKSWTILRFDLAELSFLVFKNAHFRCINELSLLVFLKMPTSDV